MSKKTEPNVAPSPMELTQAEKEALWLEAEADVAEELKAAEKERLLKEYKKEVRRSRIPEEALEPILIDVAGHSNKITLDSVEYFHGTTYYLSQAQRATINDIMSQTWKHEREIGGANSNAYRAPLDRTIRPADMSRPLSSLLRM